MLTNVITPGIMEPRGVRVMGLQAWLRGLLSGGVYRSQYEMAEKFETRQPTINHWLQGVRFPGRESCVKISKATGRTVDEIVEMVEEDTRAAELEAARSR